jgi:hypothetical protein
MNKAIDPTYSILFGCPWLRDAKIIHDRGINMVIVEGNGTMKSFQFPNI